MKEIRGLAETLYRSDREEIENAIKRILTISFTARREGILALDVLVLEDEENYIGKHFLQRAVEDLCNGMAPEQISDLMTNRILAETDIKKQFICLLYKTGMELVTAGENIRCIQSYLGSLFPESCEDDVVCYIEQVIDQHHAKIQEEKAKCVPDEFYAISVEVPDEVNERLKKLENIILEKNDKQVQNILRNAENFDVCSLLLAGTEAFRNQILDNMSNRLRIMVMEDVIARAKDVEKHYEEEIKNIRMAIERTEECLLHCGCVDEGGE